MCFTISGIIINMIGTIMTIWSVISSDPKTEMTFGGLQKRIENYPIEFKRIWLGFAFIVIGSGLQVVGAILS